MSSPFASLDPEDNPRVEDRPCPPEVALSARSASLEAGQRRILELILGEHSLESVLRAGVNLVESQATIPVRASILLLEGNRLRHGAAPNLPEEYTRAIDGVEIGPEVGSCGTAAYLNDTICVEDIQSDPKWAAFTELAARSGLSACWSTPIRAGDGSVLGTFAIYLTNPGMPTAADLSLVEIVTRTVAIGIEHKAADEKIKRENARYSAALAFEREIEAFQGSVRDLQTFILERVQRLLGADGACFKMVDGDEMVFEAATGVFASFRGLRVSKAQSLSGQCLASGVIVHCEGAKNDARVLHLPQRQAEGFSHLVVPLRHGDEGFGTLVVAFDGSHRLNDEHARTLELLGGFIGATVGRARVAAALRESEDHSRFMLDASPQIPWTAAASGHLIEMSERWLERTGLPKEAALGAGWVTILHPEDLDATMLAWGDATANGIPYDIEQRWRMADGTYRWVRTRAVPRFGTDGRVVRWYGTTEDIHERKIAEQNLERLVVERTAELERANAELVLARDAALAASLAKTEFLANMSHEIRTPLNGVLGMASLLQDLPLEPEAREMVGTIATSGETLLRVLGEILDLSKVEAGRVEVERVGTDLVQLARDVVDLFQGHARAKGLDLRFVPPTRPLPRLLADPLRLRQVLSNLVSNAVKFTEQGHIELGVAWERQADGFGVRLTVSDTGIGIPRDRLAAVFESFTQADGSVQRRFGGTGLGLTISKKLVQLMGGEIRVESKVGVGSRFTIEMGLRPAEDEPTDRTADAPRPLRRGIKVLLVEDNPVNLKVAQKLLERCGCAVESAENGLRAIAMVSEREYDVVLMDVQMPFCDGLEATRAIREAESRKGYRRLPIIALTANAMDSDRDACTEAGMDGFLTKPLTLGVLRETIATFDADDPSVPLRLAS